MIALILAIAFFVFYNVFIIHKYKTVPVSLSETSYIASPTWFSSFIGTEAILLLAPWLAKTSLAIFPYWATICLVVCASAPLFKEKQHKCVHYTSAILALIGFLAWIVMDCSTLWLLTALIPIGLTVFYKADRYVYWFEIWAFLLLGALLI